MPRRLVAERFTLYSTFALLYYCSASANITQQVELVCPDIFTLLK